MIPVYSSPFATASVVDLDRGSMSVFAVADCTVWRLWQSVAVAVFVGVRIAAGNGIGATEPARQIDVTAPL